MQEAIEVNDPIYGDKVIQSPVLIDLIDSSPVQRLKRINQLGMPDEFYHVPNFSRYDHCVGVMLLLEHLGASEAEQVAGLLHDVSHMAFSHLYDWVVDDYTKPGGTESRQDDGHVDFIRQSEIPEVLVRHGMNVDRVADYHHFGLLERDSPDLCVDGIDYSLREFPTEVAKTIFSGLTVVEGQVVCQDLETAALFGRAYLKLQTEHWGGYEATARYHQFSSALRMALVSGEVTPEDFLVDDDHVTNKLKTSTNQQIQSTLELLRQKPLPPTQDGVKVYKKFRYINPPFVSSTFIIRLTEQDLAFKNLLDEARAQNKQGVLVPDYVRW